VILVATKDIEKDEEILTEYGPQYWQKLYMGAEFDKFKDGLDIDSDAEK